MKNIITVQHTQSVQHTNGMIGSWNDWKLTELGVSQAENIAKNLFREFGGNDYVIYSSDLIRAKQTAEILSRAFGVKPVFSEALREFNLGEAVGKTKEWAKTNAICHLWQRTIDWAVSVDDAPFKDAETKREVWDRLNAFLIEILASKDENIIIVSHDGTLSLLYPLWMGLEIEMLEKINFNGKTGGVSLLREDMDKRRSIIRLNDLSYIE